MATHQKFIEIIKPGTNIDFVGAKRYWIGASLVVLLLSLLMLPINAYLVPGRGHMLNWGVDFKGGSEIVVEFSKDVDVSAIRDAVAAGGFHGSDVFKYGQTPGVASRKYMIRLGAVSAISKTQAEKAEMALGQVGDAKLKGKLEWSEGGDKVYVRFDKSVDPTKLGEAFKAAAGIVTSNVQTFGRSEENTYEVTLVGLDIELAKALDVGLGAGVAKIQSVSSVGAKAGKQLRDDGLKAIVGAIFLIVVYVAFRFDFRYGPGTIVALFHDAVITIGAFALTYKEFSLTTLAALLTIIGFSMNDTIVVFDRIRENASKYRDRQFDKIVNQSINETLSRTILTSATVFFVTLAMNIWGTGTIRDFAFAMNVGVIVGTYSSIFIASPILIWLNDKYVAAQKRQKQRPARRPVARDEEPIET